VYHFVNMPPSLGQMSNLVVGMLSWSDMFWHVSTRQCSITNLKTAIFMNTYVPAAEPEALQSDETCVIN
jgi:hypothetical protein